MDFVVELERVRVSQIFALDLEIGMVRGKRLEDLRIALDGPGRLEVDEKTVLGNDVEVARWKEESLLRRSLHDLGITVAGDAVNVGDRLHGAGAEVLVMTIGAGMIHRRIGLVEGVHGVALFAIGVDGSSGDGRLEQVDLPGRFVALLAIPGELAVGLGDAAGGIDQLETPGGLRAIKINHRPDSGDHHASQGHQPPCEAKRVPTAGVTAIARILLRDLFLVFARRGHGSGSLGVEINSHNGVNDGQNNE